MKLPKIIISTVIRTVEKGDIHGQVYIVDLDSGESNLVINWDYPSINWDGRGGDRGLRGIAVSTNKCYIASSETIHAYSNTLQPLENYTHRILKGCHEIFLYNDNLYITSTECDSIVVYNIPANKFTKAYQLRFNGENSLMKNYERFRRKFAPVFLPPRKIKSRYSFTVFTPERFDEITSGDTMHINNVYVDKTGIYFSAQKNSNYMFRLNNDQISYHSLLIGGTHNAMPYSDKIIYNDTHNDKVCLANRKGEELLFFPVLKYDKKELTNTDIPPNFARQGWGRGLAIYHNDYIIAGSSPTTISVYSISQKQLIKHIQLSNDIRHAVHGLEIWPF